MVKNWWASILDWLATFRQPEWAAILVGLMTLGVVFYQVWLMGRQTTVIEKQDELLARKAQLRIVPRWRERYLEIRAENDGNRGARDFYWHLYIAFDMIRQVTISAATEIYGPPYDESEIEGRKYRRHTGFANYALSQLSFAGKYAAKIPDNWESYDLAVEPGSGLIRVSVKTRSESEGWKISRWFNFDDRKECDWIVFTFKPKTGSVRRSCQSPRDKPNRSLEPASGHPSLGALWTDLRNRPGCLA